MREETVSEQVCSVLSEFDEARNSQLLAEDVGLEEARTRSESLNWGQRDDVTTALFFHVNSFPGAADELAALRQVVKQLSPGSERNVSEIPFTSDAKRQERALHRLIVLGVVDDYALIWLEVRSHSARFRLRRCKAQPACLR